MSEPQTYDWGLLKALVDSHPSIHEKVHANPSLLWDDHLNPPQPNYWAVAATCETAFWEGYTERTFAENQHILTVLDTLFADYGHETGVGYALDVTFGENMGIDIKTGKCPLTLNDLTPYPHLKARVERTVQSV